jgi:alkylated DNA repair dioxygenase AlkB
MTEIQPSLFPIRISEGLPEGFEYCEQAISSEHESRVLAQLADLSFKEFQFRGFEGKRRVVSFGWRYDFNDHKVLPADPIPPFLLEVYRTVQATSRFVLRDLQQVLVSEYAPGAPIGWHKDRPVFGDVMGLSLASSCSFRLRKLLDNGNWKRATVVLEPGSAYFLRGPVRWEWEHSILPMKALRYSITFRNLRRRPNRVSFNATLKRTDARTPDHGEAEARRSLPSNSPPRPRSST